MKIHAEAIGVEMNRHSRAMWNYVVIQNSDLDL
jgi:hypothetical protein